MVISVSNVLQLIHVNYAYKKEIILKYIETIIDLLTIIVLNVQKTVLNVRILPEHVFNAILYSILILMDIVALAKKIAMNVNQLSILMVRNMVIVSPVIVIMY